MVRQAVDCSSGCTDARPLRGKVSASLAELCPAVLKYLGLPPGWRFLLHDDHSDVWEDSKLLVV